MVQRSEKLIQCPTSRRTRGRRNTPLVLVDSSRSRARARLPVAPNSIIQQWSLIALATAKPSEGDDVVILLH